MDDLKITKIGGGIFEIEVPQDEDTTFVYTVSESDLNRLKANKMSKWEVKYVASAVRETRD
jgi:hypothetical protein